jgi:hypothetical protein
MAETPDPIVFDGMHGLGDMRLDAAAPGGTNNRMACQDESGRTRSRMVGVGSNNSSVTLHKANSGNSSRPSTLNAPGSWPSPAGGGGEGLFFATHRACRCNRRRAQS